MCDHICVQPHLCAIGQPLIHSLFFAFCLLLPSCHNTSNSVANVSSSDTISILSEVETLYGLPVDSFVVEKTSVRRGQIISQILTEAGLPYATAIVAYDKTMPVFDFRQMRAGNTCYLFHDLDTTAEGTLRHFVYEISPTDYVRLTFADTIGVIRQKIDVSTRQRAAHLQITTSLWNAMTAQGLNPQIALDMADIFAWTVDFFGIEKGDEFAVLYDEKCVGSDVVGIGAIRAAVFRTCAGRKLYAFRHESDSTSGYYDLQGNSLRRTFLKAPLRYNRISSRFSNGRMHPVLKIRRPHHGVDYAAPQGTPVLAIADGRVVAKGWDAKGGGNYVKIKHNSMYVSEYMHLNNFAAGLKKGQDVKQGELIGNVGSTGLATGPHLDFRIFRDGRLVDPLKVDMPPAEPINNDDILDFMEMSDKLKSSLDSTLQVASR